MTTMVVILTARQRFRWNVSHIESKAAAALSCGDSSNLLRGRRIGTQLSRAWAALESSLISGKRADRCEVWAVNRQ